MQADLESARKANDKMQTDLEDARANGDNLKKMSEENVKTTMNAIVGA